MLRWVVAFFALAGAGGAPASLGASAPVPSPSLTAPPSASGEKVSPVAPKREEPAAGEKSAGAAPKPEAPPAHEPPPISITALRDEIHRAATRDNQPAADREKMERLAADITKARESLREETARLEALLAKRDPSPAAPAAGSGGGADGVEGAKKVPTSLDGLAKAMRGMKPEQAAPIITRLERKTAADVLQRMPATDAGKVMGQCKPEVAAELATEIASRTPRSELKR